MIIHFVNFCGMHELPLRGHDESEAPYNRGTFLELMSELASLDSDLDEHICTGGVGVVVLGGSESYSILVQKSGLF
jgi:hypothetical protein